MVDYEKRSTDTKDSNIGFHGVAAALGADNAKKKESSSSEGSTKKFSKAHLSYNVRIITNHAGDQLHMGRLT